MSRYIPFRKRPVTNLDLIVDCLKTAYVRDCAYSFEVQLEASRFLRDEIIDRTKTGSYASAFAKSVYHLGWRTPQWIFGKGYYKDSLFCPEQKKLMDIKLDKKDGSGQLIDLARKWSETEAGTLGAAMEVIARNYIYFKSKGAFDL